MFYSQQKSTGTDYTMTVALLVVAFVFCPAILILTLPLGYPSLMAGVGISGVCVAIAWRNWKRHSQLTTPSIEPPYVSSK